MYVYLTPITPWESYATLPGRFSDKSWLSFDFTTSPGVIARSAFFIRAMLQHRNPYLDDGRGRTYGAEPGIAFIGLMNEPEYRTDPSGRYADGVYSYEFLKTKLINGLVAAVREGEAVPGGVHHLVGWNMTNWDKTKSEPGADGVSAVGGANPNVPTSVHDSAVEFLALSGYTRVWWKDYPYFRDPDDEPFLKLDQIGERPPVALDRSDLRRANVIYEWDAPGSQKTYIYPNLAAKMRAAGNQAAAFFQYDMAVEAHQNAVWPRHYLNWLYTPEKSIAFMIAGRVFRDDTVKGPYRDGELAHIGDHAVTSFAGDASLFFDRETLLYSRSVPPSLAVSAGALLRHVAGVGSSEVVQYDGSGLYRLDKVTRLDGSWFLELFINPDVDIRNRTYDLNGRHEHSTVPFDPSGYAWSGPTKLFDTRTIVSRRHYFVLRWPGMQHFRIARVDEHQTDGEPRSYQAGDRVDVIAGTVSSNSPGESNSTHYRIYPAPSKFALRRSVNRRSAVRRLGACRKSLTSSD
jgi:hypothetical protein